MSFATYFGNEEGIQVLLKKLKDNSKNLNVLVEILEKELEILEFSKEKYKKISLKTRELNSSEEYKTMRHTMVRMEEIYLEKSKILEQSLESLKIQVLEPLRELSNYQNQARKSHKLNLDKSLKTYQQTELAFYKSKDKYFSKQKELLGLKEGYPSLNSKESLKRDQKMDKLTREIEGLDVEYQHNGVLVNEAWNVWEKTVLATCKEGEKMDRDRVNMLREKLWIYANIYSDSFVAQDEGCERIRASLEKCDFENDIQEFLKLTGTGVPIKEPPSYVPFTVETAEEYDSMGQRAGRTNSFLNLLGIGNFSIPSFASGRNSNDYGNFITSDLQMPQEEMEPKPTLPTHYTLTRSNAPNAQSIQESELTKDFKSQEENMVPEIPVPNYNIYDFSRVNEILFHVYVLYDYQATAPEELTIFKGQLLAVFNTHEDGWWEAVGFGSDGRERIGLFPSNFCKKVQLNENQHPISQLDGQYSGHVQND